MGEHSVGDLLCGALILIGTAVSDEHVERLIVGVESLGEVETAVEREGTREARGRETHLFENLREHHVVAVYHVTVSRRPVVVGIFAGEE
jgi:hypothetical protein